VTPYRTHLLAERLVARALLGADPARALRRAARDRRVPRALRDALLRCAPDGVRLTALLIIRLRFERLLRGCPEAEAWFERDGPGFTRAFARYHRQVPPTAFFPAAEARLFRTWAVHVQDRRAGTPVRFTAGRGPRTGRTARSGDRS